jgi:hypothetical protein
MVTLECLGHLPGPRFLDGRVLEGSVGLAPHTDPPFTGTWWAVTTLSPGVVKFRCMATVPATSRFLDGRTHDGSVGLAPPLAIPLTGERWDVTEHFDGSVSLRCLGDFDSPQFRFLDGRTLEEAVGLVPHTDAPFSGTHWRVKAHGKIVVLEYMGSGRFGSDRFLDGRLLDPAQPVGLAPVPMEHFTGTRWLMTETGGEVTLKCLGEVEANNRFLDGIVVGRKVGLAPHTDPPFTGTRWKPTELPSVHSDVEPGSFVTLCLAPPNEPLFLDGDLQTRGAGLAPPTEEPYSGTRLRVLSPSAFWEPCPRYHEWRAPHPTVDVVRSSRVGQLTGSADPQGWPLINGNTSVWAVSGVDLGATTEHRVADQPSRLFIFFGDVVRPPYRQAGPPHDSDAVAWTVDPIVQEGPDGGGGIRLNFVVQNRSVDPGLAPGVLQYFDPIFVKQAPFVSDALQIGYTGTIETPSGAFSFNDKVYVFVGVQGLRKERGDGELRPYPKPGNYLISKSEPHKPGPFDQLRCFSPAEGGALAAVAPVKVVNAEHNWLPPSEHPEGLVMFSLGWNNHVQYSAIHLSWMPLKDGVDPQPSDVLYFSRVGPGGSSWRPEPDDVAPIFGKESNLIHLSAAYIKGLGQWIVARQSSNPTNNIQGPIIARIGTPPLAWSTPFDLFDPCRDGAYGKYMHWPELGHDIPWMSYQPDPWAPGAAYGAFLLERYTRWKDATGELDLYYLMSTGSPYQVQLMHTTLRLGVRIPEWLTKEEVEGGDEMGGMTRPSAEELGLVVTFMVLQREPGFEHGQVVSISPPAGTLVRPGGTVTVTINLEG